MAKKIKRESDCRGCAECKGCGRDRLRDVEYLECDSCGGDVNKLFVINEKELCEECLFNEIEIIEL